MKAPARKARRNIWHGYYNKLKYPPLPTNTPGPANICGPFAISARQRAEKSVLLQINDHNFEDMVVKIIPKNCQSYW